MSPSSPLVSPLTLVGRHVRLEPLSRDHVPALRAIAEGPRDTFTLTTVPFPDGVAAYVDFAIAQVEQRKALVFAIRAPSGEVVGSTRLFDLQRWDWPYGRDPRAGQDVLDGCEIGWTFLAPSAQRTAINTEAKLLLLRHAFEVFRVHRVTIKTDVRNERSRRAIERLGAHFDGVLRANQPAVDGKPRDSAWYTILAAEWPSVRDGLLARLAR